MSQIFDFFIDAYRETPTHLITLEAIAFVFGIISVWFAKKANIWVYPTGIICTVITVYLLYINEYFGDMMMNFYYSVMSIYGWWNWARKKGNAYAVPISRTSQKEKNYWCYSVCIDHDSYVFSLQRLRLSIRDSKLY